jgi:hypothetical protein
LTKPIFLHKHQTFKTGRPPIESVLPPKRSHQRPSKKSLKKGLFTAHKTRKGPKKTQRLSALLHLHWSWRETDKKSIKTEKTTPSSPLIERDGDRH